MILCCGEALIDMLPRLDADGAAVFAPHAGGAVFNTAIALGRLGMPAGFLSGISSDFFGEQLLARLAASKVNASHVIIQDRPTTLAFVRLVDGQASYAFYDENTAGRMLVPDAMPRLGADVKALFFGGISLAVEPCGKAYEALMLREAQSRATMIDPNIRPGFIKDEATYRARLGAMIAASTIVKLSDEDLHWLEGAGGEGELARGLLARGPSVVLITKGGAGATAHMASGTIHADSRRVEVVDTVGAGDTFNAGFMTALERRGQLTREALAKPDHGAIAAALELGARAAAVTVSRAGANPPWQSELT